MPKKQKLNPPPYAESYHWVTLLQRHEGSRSIQQAMIETMKLARHPTAPVIDAGCGCFVYTLTDGSQMTVSEDFANVGVPGEAFTRAKLAR